MRLSLSETLNRAALFAMARNERGTVVVVTGCRGALTEKNFRRALTALLPSNTRTLVLRTNIACGVATWVETLADDLDVQYEVHLASEQDAFGVAALLVDADALVVFRPAGCRHSQTCVAAATLRRVTVHIEEAESFSPRHS